LLDVTPSKMAEANDLRIITRIVSVPILSSRPFPHVPA